MATFVEATETNDEDKRKALMDKILAYNKEDLEATWAVFRWLESKVSDLLFSASVVSGATCREELLPFAIRPLRLRLVRCRQELYLCQIFGQIHTHRAFETTAQKLGTNKFDFVVTRHSTEAASPTSMQSSWTPSTSAVLNHGTAATVIFFGTSVFFWRPSEDPTVQMTNQNDARRHQNRWVPDQMFSHISPPPKTVSMSLNLFYQRSVITNDDDSVTHILSFRRSLESCSLRVVRRDAIPSTNTARPLRPSRS